ncbi:hypothetical protein GA0070214_11539 [Micromonospora chaiyaphumensis]|uniref:Uncharacterized protein n=1 Tax=Micromonospora chaiyaphumensis TaxID=307119 RepID=A0A1C4ZJ74_9ACTN|nr:hypothetical protein GA0070214_11539 [Micromonospora chaiyaphumensis]
MLSWVGVGVVLGGLAGFLVVVGLDDADRYASVFALFVGIAALSATVYGIVSGRPAPAPSPPPLPVTVAQQVEGLDAGRDIDVVDGVRGNLRMGTAPSSVTPPSATSEPPQTLGTPTVPGKQVVHDVRAKGAIRIVRGVDGDVDINP